MGSFDANLRGNLGVYPLSSFKRGRELCRATSWSPASQSRDILRLQKVDVGRYPRILGDGVSLTMGRTVMLRFQLKFTK